MYCVLLLYDKDLEMNRVVVMCNREDKNICTGSCCRLPATPIQAYQHRTVPTDSWFRHLQKPLQNSSFEFTHLHNYIYFYACFLDFLDSNVRLIFLVKKENFTQVSILLL